MPPGGKQPLQFALSKRNALQKLDKSPKGSLDEPIAALVHAISTAASSRQSASKAVPKRPQSDAHTPHQPHLVSSSF